METALLLLVILASGWLLFAQAARLDALFRREPAGYYGLLVEGFRHGHLYAAVQPHPGLLALPNPYDPVANAPYRVHDLSLYRGHYYLYFGVTPALIFLWPVEAVTGWYPTQVCAVAFFCTGGIAAAVLLLAAVRRRHFPRAPLWSLALGALGLALANPIWWLTRDGDVYNVPIACAFCLNFCMLAAVYRALHAGRHATVWMATASLLFGLAVGARPDYLFSGLALVIPCAWLIRELRAGRLGSATGGRIELRLVLATFGPAALCGLGLALYNALRFGSIFEFGMQYQLAGESFLHFQPLGLRHLWPNGSAYLFAAGAWQRYFPFFNAPAGGGYGLLRYLPWLWLAPLAFLPGSAREAGGQRGLRVMTAMLLLGWAANFALLSCFFGTTLRYQSDHGPALLLLAGIGCVAAASRVSSRAARAGIAILAVAACGCSMAVNWAALAARDSGPAALLSIARFFDGPVARLERMRNEQYGALQLDLELPPAGDLAIEPLFETGRAADRRDWLQIAYLPGNRAQLGFFHAGTGLVAGRPFPIPPSRRISVEAQCGSLLPPYAHPTFANWSEDDYTAASRELLLKVDGVEVLHAALGCYPSAPGDLRLGANRWLGDGVAGHFSGRILADRRLPLARPAAVAPVLHEQGEVELQVVFPADRNTGMEPLLATGQGLQADLVYCSYEGPGKLRLALDHSNSGGPRSNLLSYDPARPCLLQFWMGSLAGEGQAGQQPAGVPPRRRIFVKMDGVVVLNEVARFNRARPETIVAGRNPFSSTEVAAHFTGEVLGLASGINPPALPVLQVAGERGAVDLKVRFPDQALGTAEPLVVTGATGAGDILYVKYVDSGHMSFGFDHWGVGGIAGQPVEIDYGEPHRLEITMGSLYPGGGAGPWAERVRVKLDGAVVLEGASACHPSEPDEITIGRNLIGGSTCGPAFTGRILGVTRPAQPAE